MSLRRVGDLRYWTATAWVEKKRSLICETQLGGNVAFLGLGCGPLCLRLATRVREHGCSGKGGALMQATTSVRSLSLSGKSSGAHLCNEDRFAFGRDDPYVISSNVCFMPWVDVLVFDWLVSVYEQVRETDPPTLPILIPATWYLHRAFRRGNRICTSAAAVVGNVR